MRWIWGCLALILLLLLLKYCEFNPDSKFYYERGLNKYDSGKIEKAEDLAEDLKDIVPEKVLKDVREKVLKHLLERFDNRDRAVLTELGDFYLLVLDEQDFENAYLWYNIASALGVQNSAEIRDKVEKELEPDTIVKMQDASRKRYKEFTSKEATEDKKEIKETEKNYESKK